MNQVTTERSPEVIATEINAIKLQTQNMMLHASAEIGRRLTEAKEIVPHGEWGNWLEANVDYKKSTANNLMQIYREYDLKSQAFGNLSYSKAIALLGIQAEERAAFIEENDVDNLSTRELQQVIKEKQALEKQLAEQASATEKAGKERDKLAKSIVKLEKQLAKEQETNNGSSKEQLEALTAELENARAKAAQFEQALKAKPLEAATATVEVIPSEVQEELEMLRSKMSESTDPAEVKFKVHFETLVSEFSKTIDVLRALSDDQLKIKYGAAMHKLLDKMRGALDE